MAYNPTDLRPMQGAIGEFLYAIFMQQQNNKSFISDPEHQYVGVDLYDKDFQQHMIDVKLNTHIGNFFSVTYRNEKNIRMPFNKGCQALWLGVVTFDWDQYIKDNLKEDANNEEKVLEFVSKVKERLSKEYEKKQGKFAKKMIDEYCHSIIDVKVQIIRDLCEGFSTKKSGEGNADKNNKIVAKRVGTDFYAAAHILWSSLHPLSKVIHWQNPNISSNHAVLPHALTVTFPFYQNKNIAILEHGNTLLEMDKNSVRWLLNESKSSKSTFYKIYGYKKDDKKNFLSLLESVLNDEF